MADPAEIGRGSDHMIAQLAGITAETTDTDLYRWGPTRPAQGPRPAHHTGPRAPPRAGRVASTPTAVQACTATTAGSVTLVSRVRDRLCRRVAPTTALPPG